ncbi:MAG TPA: branched-chain amino acid aminotransferase [Phycisphaerales bacterium]|nr:branched-chain amino acid aminotransferase [Phycisphaerales bacterium]
MKIWMNGKLVDRGAAHVSVFDHGLLYGDGVFEGIRAYGGKVFQCAAHIERLYDSARHIRLAIPYTKQEMIDAIYETLHANNVADGYVRLVVTRGEGNLGLSPFRCHEPTTFIIADQIALYPKEMYDEGMAVIIAKTVRVSPTMVPSAAKTLNYLNNILAKIEAVDAGVAEAVMLNTAGNVSECTGDNIFLVRDGELVTSPLSASVLPGITRGIVLRLARENGVPVRERDVTPRELYEAQECFLTGTAAEVIAVTKIDDRQIGDGRVGPVTQKLFAAFRQYIKSGKWD